MDSWLLAVRDCDHKYAWDGTGIAVDSKNRRLFLASKFNKTITFKDYSFSDVRKWEYEMPGFTTVLGNADLQTQFVLGVLNMTLMEKNIGLQLTVKDKEYPNWFIKFKCDGKAKMALSQWMEILRQEINND